MSRSLSLFLSLKLTVGLKSIEQWWLLCLNEIPSSGPTISQYERETTWVLFLWVTNQSRLLDGNWIYVIIGEVTHGEPWLSAAASLPFPRHLTGGQEERCYIAAAVEAHHSHGLLLVKLHDHWSGRTMGLWSYTILGTGNPSDPKVITKFSYNQWTRPLFF